ncbi:MAG: hypothetical protein ACOH2D_01465 [Gelidibacter sp.]|uniref:hypothetical protein n=1 Tax=Gelidibacter sp. TaxID=2018083 RepID=UPI00326768B6
MGGLTISSKILDKYFGYLKNLDVRTKKNLILKLTESMENKPNKKTNPEDLFGAWIDKRSSDDIISDIRNSRIEKLNTEDL